MNNNPNILPWNLTFDRTSNYPLDQIFVNSTKESLSELTNIYDGLITCVTEDPNIRYSYNGPYVIKYKNSSYSPVKILTSDDEVWMTMEQYQSLLEHGTYTFVDDEEYGNETIQFSYRAIYNIYEITDSDATVI